MSSLDNMGLKKILVVDDEVGIRESLNDYLELEGFSVMTADCGEAAVNLLSSEQFDLILSDVRMPRGDGLYLLNKVKQKHYMNPVVVLMSGFTDLTLEEAYNMGARGFFVKPFNPQLLVKALKNYLASGFLQTDLTDQVEMKLRQIKFDAKNLKEGLDKGLYNIGQKGLFIPEENTFPAVGDAVEIAFTDLNCSGKGLVRWVRQVGANNKQKGYGLELLSLSDTMSAELEQFAHDSRTISTIPSGFSF